MPAHFLDIDDCVNHTCANGGLCVDGVNSYSCNCSAGYTGEHCLAGTSNFDLYRVGTTGVLFWRNLFLSNHEVCFFPI